MNTPFCFYSLLGGSDEGLMLLPGLAEQTFGGSGGRTENEEQTFGQTEKKGVTDTCRKHASENEERSTEV